MTHAIFAGELSLLPVLAGVARPDRAHGRSIELAVRVSFSGQDTATCRFTAGQPREGAAKHDAADRLFANTIFGRQIDDSFSFARSLIDDQRHVVCDAGVRRSSSWPYYGRDVVDFATRNHFRFAISESRERAFFYNPENKGCFAVTVPRALQMGVGVRATTKQRAVSAQSAFDVVATADIGSSGRRVQNFVDSDHADFIVCRCTQTYELEE